MLRIQLQVHSRCLYAVDGKIRKSHRHTEYTCENKLVKIKLTCTTVQQTMCLSSSQSNLLNLNSKLHDRLRVRIKDATRGIRSILKRKLETVVLVERSEAAKT